VALPVDYISHSQLNVLRRCGEQYRRKYLDKEPIPASVNQILGSATHFSAETNLSHKIESESLLSTEECADLAASKYDELIVQDLHLTENEQEQGKDKVIGEAKDRTVKSAVVHATVLAPKLNPAFVEKKFRVNAGHSVDLLAIMDCGEQTENHELIIRDLKTSGKKPVSTQALTSPQLTFYDLVLHESGMDADRYALDYIVKGEQVVVQQARRDEEDRKIMLGVIERAIEVIEKGAFVPTDPSNWWCSKSYCWYAPTCPFFAGRKTLAVGG